MEEKSIINRLLGLVRLHDDKVKKNTPDAWSTEGIWLFLEMNFQKNRVFYVSNLERKLIIAF